MRLLHFGFVLLLAAAGFADVITLKSGRVINGTYLGGTPQQVKVQINDQIETFDTSQVAKIEFGNGAAAAPSDRNRPVLRRADQTSDSSSNSDSDPNRPTLRRDTASAPPPSDDSRPTLRRAPNSASDDGRPTLQRDPSPAYDDPPPPLRRGSNSSSGEAPQVLNPGDTGPTAASTAASVAAVRAPVEIPAGTNLVVRIIDPVDSETASTGQTFRATVDQSVLVAGNVAIRRGADALVKLVDAKQAGKLTGHSELTLALDSVTVDGRVIQINTQNITEDSANRGKSTATKAGAGAVIGAVIGGMAGGGKGAAAGAGAGAGAGTAVEAVSKGPKVKVPSETRLTFVLDNPVTL